MTEMMDRDRVVFLAVIVAAASFLIGMAVGAAL